MAQRVPAALETEIVYFVTRLLWQMMGLMLMGMALFKLGVLSAARSRAFYLRMASLGFGAGTPVDRARAPAELRDGSGTSWTTCWSASSCTTGAISSWRWAGWRW